MKGKFIVLYGANNLGKSTQVKLLVKNLTAQGRKVKTLKYPVYDLVPTGPLINDVLRNGKKMDTRSLQILYAQNRQDYEPIVLKLIAEGYWIIVEDYVGTGIVWGMVGGLDIESLEKINENLLKEDLSIVLDGEQFKDGRESGHINESNEERWQKGRDTHKMLAKRYNWHTVNANQSVEAVQHDILSIIEREMK